MTEHDSDDAPTLFGPVEAPHPEDGSEKGAPEVEPLTAREKEMLLLERKWFRYRGAKETIVRERWDISMTRYYQLLNNLVDKDAALAWDAITVRRLRRHRATTQRTRSVRRFGQDD
jgi:hypothetical protein